MVEVEWNQAVLRRSTLPASFFLLVALLSGVLGVQGQAQSAPAPDESIFRSTPSPQQPGQIQLPDAPGQSNPDQQPLGSIHGTVIDPNGDVVSGAHVTLEAEATKAQQTLVTGDDGFFNFPALQSGSFRVIVTATGFAKWIGPEIDLPPMGSFEVPRIMLKILPANTEVQVIFTRHDLAEEQMKAQERQRILGVFPNFYASYVWRAAPLSSGQKFRLALRTTVDPVTFASDGITAAIEQSQDYSSGFGSGGTGYAKRFGATYANDAIGTFVGSAILPSIFHQDPRFFYKGTGSVSSRALYAVSTVAICRGDNGHWQPNYSNIFGNLIAAAISNLYYPEDSRSDAAVTIDNALIGTAEGAISALFQEFVIKKISRGIQRPPSPQP
jgi:hypothetical protein